MQNVDQNEVVTRGILSEVLVFELEKVVQKVLKAQETGFKEINKKLDGVVEQVAKITTALTIRHILDETDEDE